MPHITALPVTGRTLAMCLLSNVSVVPTQTPAVRALAELHAANGSMRSHGSSVLLLTTVAPGNPKASTIGWCKLRKQCPACGFSLSTNRSSWESCATCLERRQQQVTALPEQGIPLAHRASHSTGGDCWQPFSIPGTKCCPGETALSPPSLGPKGESKRQLLQSFILGEESCSYCSARAGTKVGD